MAKITQTAGRNALGEFAPEFAHFNDDVLFGENWNNQDIDVKTRSIITVVALMAQGITDSSLKFHLQNAKDHGVTQKEIAAIITHVAFYAGWPKGWAVFNLAKEVWTVNEGDLPYEDKAMRAHAKEMVFPIGTPNNGFAQYFSGRSFLAPVSTSQVGIFNVTFEPGCRNNWHIHHAKNGGGHHSPRSPCSAAPAPLFSRAGRSISMRWRTSAGPCRWCLPHSLSPLLR